MSPRKKRKRGAQPGNTNARRHGLYAATVIPEEMAKLALLLRENRGSPDLFLLRIRLTEVLKRSPENPRAFREVMSLIARHIREHYDLEAEDRALVRQVLAASLASVFLQARLSDGTNGLVTSPILEDIRNESNVEKADEN